MLNSRHVSCALIAGLAVCVLQSIAFAGEHRVAGSLSVEARYFPEETLFSVQEPYNFSIALEPEYSYSWSEGRGVIAVQPFLRADLQDDERSHWDIRELSWVQAWRDWELRLGVSKVFWGVAESQHLVDVINQTDFVENIDGEDKLGQPMLSLAWFSPVGTLSGFLLPYFRERTFPGRRGRPRFALVVDTDTAIYESSAEEYNVDWALRWSHSLGPVDLGLSHFSGTGRDPTLVPGINGRLQRVLFPRYLQIHQSGLDAQITWESFLGKLEFIRRDQRGGRFIALVGGGEYSFYQVLGTAADLGVLLEYHFHDRPSLQFTPFQNDLFAGLRLALNDTASTEFLGGVIRDLDSTALLYFVEASRRLGERWKVEVEARGFNSIPATDPFNGLRQDSFVQTSLFYYF